MSHWSTRAAAAAIGAVGAMVAAMVVTPSAGAATSGVGAVAVPGVASVYAAAPMIDTSGACAVPTADMLGTATFQGTPLARPQVSPQPPGDGSGLPGDDSAFAATLLATTTPLTDGVPSRIGGASRYETAAQIARLHGYADAVIVANGADAKGGFDALSANYLAGLLSAPIVLTAGTTLEVESASAVAEILAGSAQPAIYVMGKSDAVSDTVVEQLNAIAATAAGVDGEYVQRIGGSSRYATSALAATTVAGASVGSVNIVQSPQLSLPTAILASGTANADALAAGPLSYAWGLPVLLTADAALSPEITGVIKDLGIRQLIVLGGTDRVSAEVVAQAQAAGAGRVTRIVGANRFETAAQLYNLASRRYVGPAGGHYVASERVFMANGLTGFPDALAVGPLAGSLGAPLLTATATDVEPATLTLLDLRSESVAAITALGATATVGNTVVITARAAAKISILAGADGVIPAADDADAQFVATAASLPGFAAKLQLALSYLPSGGDGIRRLCPQMLQGWEDDAAGLTQFRTCDVWMDNTLADEDILDILRHEYIHVLQCVGENQGFDPGYDLSNDTVVNGVERGADAGAYLLGNRYMYYVEYGPTAGPLQSSEIAIAQRLFARFNISYRVG